MKIEKSKEQNENYDYHGEMTGKLEIIVNNEKGGFWRDMIGWRVSDDQLD